MGSLVGLFTGILTRSRFTQNVAALSGGTALGQVLLILAAPLLTRLYTPEDMGLMGLFLAYFGFVTVAVSLRYDTAIVAAANRHEAAQLALLSMTLVLPSGLICAAALYGLIRLSVVGFGHLPPSTALLVVPAVLLAGVFGTLRYWFVREESLGAVSQALVFQSGARSLFQIGFGALGLGWLGLLGGELLGRAVGLGRMFRSAWPAISAQVFPLRSRELGAVLRSYRKFPMYLLPSALMDTLALSIPLPLLAGLYGPSAAGQFSLVLRVLALPLALVGTSVADAFHGRMAAYVREEPKESLRFFQHTSKGLFLLGLVPALLLVLFGPEIFRVIFGQAWGLAGKLASVMAPWALTQLVVSPVSRVIFVLQRPELKLSYDIFVLCVTVGAITVGHRQGLSLLQTVLCLSLANVLAYALYFVVLLRIQKRIGQ